MLAAFRFLRPPSLYLFAQVSSNRAIDPSMKRAGCQATATVTEQCIRTLRHPLPCWKSITHFCMHYGQRRAPSRLLTTSTSADEPALPPCPFCSYHSRWRGGLGPQDAEMSHSQVKKQLSGHFGWKVVILSLAGQHGCFCEINPKHVQTITLGIISAVLKKKEKGKNTHFPCWKDCLRPARIFKLFCTYTKQHVG